MEHVYISIPPLTQEEERERCCEKGVLIGTAIVYLLLLGLLVFCIYWWFNGEHI